MTSLHGGNSTFILIYLNYSYLFACLHDAPYNACLWIKAQACTKIGTKTDNTPHDVSSDLTPLHRRRAYCIERNGNVNKDSSAYVVHKSRGSHADSSDGEVTLNGVGGGGRKRTLLAAQISHEMQSLVDETEGGKLVDSSGDGASVEMSNEAIEGDVQVYGFLFEELVLQAMRNGMALCPKHGQIKLNTIAPDVVSKAGKICRIFWKKKTEISLQNCTFFPSKSNISRE